MTFGFFLCGEKGLRVLEAVTQIPGIEIAFVMAARDGGLTEDHYKAIEALCANRRMIFYERNEYGTRTPVKRERETDMPATDHSFAAGWKWMIRDRPNLIVLHDSLLPRYRGNCPVVQALINGSNYVGVTAFLATDEMDAGPVFDWQAVEVEYPIKVAAAISRVAEAAARLTTRVIQWRMAGTQIQWQNSTAIATPSYSLWRDEQDYRIDWTTSAGWIKRFIDAVGPPYAGAYSQYGNPNTQVFVWPTVRIFDAEVFPNLVIEDRESHIGKVFRVENGCPVIVCGEGLLKLTEVTNAPKSWYRQRLV